MAGPKSSDVLRALRAHMDVRAHSMRRFPTGLAHYVYEIMTDSEPVVVRMADPEHWNGIPGGVYWHDRLASLGVPLPKLYGYDLQAPFPYMILERLPGRDLGEVYPALTVPQKQALANRVVEIQDAVGTLPPASSYGYLNAYEAPSEPHPNWQSVLEAGLSEAEHFIARIGIFDPGLVQEVRRAAAPYEHYFDSVPPAPFLDDTTTKNVIVHDGRLSGIVDVDVVCFGDRLYVLALTNMALLSIGQPTDYLDFWAEGWRCSREDLRVTRLYTLMHGVYFMSEIGRRWNDEKPEAVSEDKVEQLNAIIRGLLEEFAPATDR